MTNFNSMIQLPESLISYLSPKGTFENSPAFQRRYPAQKRPSPEGTAEFAIATLISITSDVRNYAIVEAVVLSFESEFSSGKGGGAGCAKLISISAKASVCSIRNCFNRINSSSAKNVTTTS